MEICNLCGQQKQVGAVCACQMNQANQQAQGQYPYMQANLPGRKMVLVAGILLTIFAGIGVLTCFFAFIFGGLIGMILPTLYIVGANKMKKA